MSVAHRIEKLQRDFLWGGMRNEFNYHLVDGKKFCEPIQNWGARRSGFGPF